MVTTAASIRFSKYTGLSCFSLVLFVLSTLASLIWNIDTKAPGIAVSLVMAFRKLA